jgi:hypothetical protein
MILEIRRHYSTRAPSQASKFATDKNARQSQGGHFLFSVA